MSYYLPSGHPFVMDEEDYLDEMLFSSSIMNEDEYLEKMFGRASASYKKVVKGYERLRELDSINTGQYLHDIATFMSGPQHVGEMEQFFKKVGSKKGNVDFIELPKFMQEKTGKQTLGDLPQELRVSLKRVALDARSSDSLKASTKRAQYGKLLRGKEEKKFNPMDKKYRGLTEEELIKLSEQKMSKKDFEFFRSEDSEKISEDIGNWLGSPKTGTVDKDLNNVYRPHGGGGMRRAKNVPPPKPKPSSSGGSGSSSSGGSGSSSSSGSGGGSGSGSALPWLAGIGGIGLAGGGYAAYRHHKNKR